MTFIPSYNSANLYGMAFAFQVCVVFITLVVLIFNQIDPTALALTLLCATFGFWIFGYIRQQQEGKQEKVCERAYEEPQGHY